MAISILLKGPDGAEKRLDFDRSKLTLGSDPLCDVTIADDGVDREQAVLVQRGGAVELFDIGERGAVLV
ncbi:MAG: FHA domain-containing protein, partial [Planctomycetota bacterium]